jgi:hypothetical protein
MMARIDTKGPRATTGRLRSGMVLLTLAAALWTAPPASAETIISCELHGQLSLSPGLTSEPTQQSFRSIPSLTYMVCTGTALGRTIVAHPVEDFDLRGQAENATCAGSTFTGKLRAKVPLADKEWAVVEGSFTGSRAGILNEAVGRVSIHVGSERDEAGFVSAMTSVPIDEETGSPTTCGGPSPVTRVRVDGQSNIA